MSNPISKQLNTPEPKHLMIMRLMAEVRTPMTAEVSLADALEYRRDQYGLTKMEFSAILGITHGHYTEVLNGIRRLPINATKRAFAIGVSAESLLRIDHE